METKTKKIIIVIVISAIILISGIIFLPNFLFDNFGECHAENGGCCKKLGNLLLSCSFIQLTSTCNDGDGLPVWKGCDDNCEHIIVCVEKFESEFGDDTEIGKSCSIDSDCKLPMSYAMISSRKYEIKCLNSKCAIIDALDNLLKIKCCEECKLAFSKSPIGVGPEAAMCGNFGSGQPVSANCKSFFENNAMSVSLCKNYLFQK